VSAPGKTAEQEKGGVGAKLVDLASRAGLDLLYLTIGMATSIIAFVVWVTALSVTISLAVFIVGLPLFLLSAIAFRWTVELDRRNAALVLGAPLRGRYRDHDGEGFLARLRSTTADPQTWKDLGWLVAHSVVGFTFGVATICLVGLTIGGATMPAWYWAVNGGADFAGMHVDTLGKAFLAMALAVPIAAITVGAVRLMAIGEAWLAALLLGAGDAEDPAAASAGPGERSPIRPGRTLAELERTMRAGLAATGLLAVLVTAVWAATGAGYFWPAWVYLGLLIPVGLIAGLREAWRMPRERRALAVQGVVSLLLLGIAVAVWALTGFGTFWPIWTILGLLTALAVHVLVATMWHRVFPDQRERELTERVETLTETRRGALDVQAAELRRIERDLHDGAQARLVALSMQLGRAEEGLADRPEIAALVRQAREEATAANAELRDLARGIAPPVLTDRGLAAAVEALGSRSPNPVTVDAQLGRRPAPVIESAAYFVVAESLTNVAKHAPKARATVTIRLDGDELDLVVADDGPGGADLAAGSGLDGLRRRVAALDGELEIASPPGEGTRIEVKLPCGS
jgi:signal transduction histidine kinase